MKKVILGLAVLLVFGFFMACDTGTGGGGGETTQPTKFEGTWKHPNTTSKNATYIFTGNSFVYKTDDSEISGTFTFDDTNIKLVSSTQKTWNTTYTLSGDTLTFKEGTGCWGWYGSYKKQ